ncbi:Rrf2 family transcriptional regulator [Pedobacter sp. MW01-1-1]|uniref:Rrf2 family transcriptional regulator n=1 Tax=Pedobacter sp. MW01-1-1 TaxID=3383027 RepID=UPI003FF11750
MNNTRFATAIHIMTLLAAMPDTWHSSEFIAGSIRINPVVVRRELSVLNNAGLVVSRKGKDGGVMLGKAKEKILLSDIYRAVKTSEVLGKKNQNPNEMCPVGKQINVRLDALYMETEQEVLKGLGEKTLAFFLEAFV